MSVETPSEGKCMGIYGANELPKHCKEEYSDINRVTNISEWKGEQSHTLNTIPEFQQAPR